MAIGLGLQLFLCELAYFRTRDIAWEAAARFWTRVFAVNFAMGVATGIVMEFEFGTESWAAALQRCSANVRAKVIKNLSPRAAQHLRAEMNYLGEVMPSEIDRGQQRVIDVSRQLNETKQIRRAA